MLVTAKTPDAIVGKLHNAMIQCVNDPKLKAEFAKFKVDLIQIESKEWIENILREREYVYPILKDLGLAK
jgi:tripartite-type tricarboxylate transporter receptor subunit TctC